MTYTPIPLEDFLSNAHSPSESELESFSKHRDKLLHTKENESEEHQKIALIEFLAKSFAYECNTKNRIDLSIYEDNKAKVLFEVKSLNNTNEFIKGGTLNTLHNLESKAFYESILYFLREYKTHNNNDIKHIILTNTRDFYLIDAREYLTFAKDKTILKAFDNCDKNQGTDTSTSKFYATLKDYLLSLNSTLKFTHFNIQTTPLPLLYQALSPQVLLKQKTYIDANTLNQSFYDELLYILGLKEIDQKGKILILPTTEQNTLLDSICNKLGLDRDKDFETIFSLLTTWNNRILFLRLLESMLLSFKHIKKPFLDIDTLQNFTDLNTLFFDILALKKEKRKTDLKLKDSIPYLNSSLFDKTELEKQNKEISKLDSNHLAIFKHSILKKDKEYKDTQSLPLLEYLFKFLHAYDFTTTPKDIINHTKTNHDKLINAAVLGLVFEKLNGYKEGSFYTPSFITSYMCKESLEKVVIDKFNERKSWECNSLESLAQKLDKLTDSKDGYKEANAIFDSIKVCDPAVGSGHFLVSMLNAMIELKFRLKILCEIHIDDNGERDYKRLKDIRLRLENDEILIQDSNNTLHTYQTPAHENLESHIIQKALFHNKRILIESCLFGVDINPNSCEITKLRLWIELLKYSFYIFDSNGKNTGDLETLPNIDINIKCGNSLVSNIALDMTKESLEKDLKNRLNDNATLESANEILSTINDIQNKLPHTIQDYKDAVSAYKNETNAELKSLHKQKIHTTQSFIIAIFHKTSKAYQNFKNTLSSYLQRYGYNGIDNATLQNKSLDSALIKSLNDYTINFNFHKSLDIPKEPQGFVEKELITLIESMREYENLINDTNAFEWRFAFPEVLDSNGDFLGFDLVIGNPPYMQVPKGLYDKTRFPYSEGKDKGKQNLYKVFVELGYNLGHTNSLVAFITQSSIMCDLSAQFTRELLLKKTQMQYFVEFKKNQKLFTGVIQGVCIMEFLKAKPKSNNHFKIAIDNTESKMDKIDFESISQKQILEFFPLYEIPLIKKGEMSIIAKVKTDKILLKDMMDSSLQGNINTIHLKRIKSEKQTGIYLIKGENIHRYFIDNNLMHCIESSETLKMCNHNAKSHIIAMQGITGTTDKNRIHCTLLECKNTNKFVFLDSTKMLFVESKETAIYLIGLLNSKLLNWLFRITSTNNNVNLYELENLPIPQITESNKPLCDEIIKCVDEILEIKACHTEALAEVSKNTESKKDISPTAQYDKADSTLDTSKLESKLDSLVYKLYNLTKDEIAIIDSKT
ncbi:MAG: Eco57I restriction-modification methylase domain-containing protein [Helicobacter sp.]|uniref:type IIG restriction enzyme/methyltransferase n=1 Tax=Helicobacter sp. TaxID=218 RepID=UPI002A919C73|nr:Eco57I restriction-modification methylase domain-containing protein [Helicobacter sp.]MDY5822090.1 Eco57I restriction-modification methylase domain-containing protein [Helicobacter sp.]